MAEEGVTLRNGRDGKTSVCFALSEAHEGFTRLESGKGHTRWAFREGVFMAA